MSPPVRRVSVILAVAVPASMGAWMATGGPSSQGPAISVELGPIVSADAPKADHVEPWLAVNPRKPGHAIAVSIGGSGSAAYVTVDGGNSWTRGRQSEPKADWFPGIDPVVTFDGQGKPYLATVSPFRVWRSNDGGHQWEGPVVIPGRAYDREYLASRGVAASVDTLYAVGRTALTVFGHSIDGAIGLARSIDGGRTFDFPRLLLPDPARSIIHTVGGIIATIDGTILISYMAHDAPVRDSALLQNHIWVIRSDDGGRRFADPVAAGASVVHGNRGDLLGVAKDVSTASLAMDTVRASPFRGRAYLSWLTVQEGRGQVMVAASSDTGRTWGPPVRVNDEMGSANHSNPMIAANAGVVAVMWNDRRADPNDLCFRATVSASVDGGASFLPNVPLVRDDTCPIGRRQPSGFRMEGFRERYLSGGETQGIAPLPGGAFLAVFMEEGDGALRLRAARVQVLRGGSHQ